MLLFQYFLNATSRLNADNPATIDRTIAGAAMDYLTISISANKLSAWSKYFMTHNI